MFGIRFSSLFRSRWMALGWAVLVCLSAVSFVAGRNDPGAAGGSAVEAAANLAIEALD